jgi:uncharacterized alpha-E superfamily protein
LYRENHDTVDGDAVIRFMTFAGYNPNAILASVNTARENARMIRDQISREMWECINGLYHFLQDASGRLSTADQLLPYGFFDEVKHFTHRFIGLTESTLLRHEGYKFLQVGRFLERADQTSRMVDLKHFLPLPEGQAPGGTVDTAGWVAILRSCSAIDAYQTVHLGEVDAARVGEFLLLAPDFPRSVRFSLRQLDSHLRSMTGTADGCFTNEAEKQIGRLASDVAFTSRDDLVRQGLHTYIDSLQLRLIGVNNAIFDTYFAVPAMDRDAEIALQQAQQIQQ